MVHSRTKSTMLTWGLGILLILTLAIPLSGAAQSTSDDQGTPVEMTGAQEPEPTTTDIPPTETPTPEPVATDTPTPEPTATEIPPTETPTDVPATETPTAAPTDTPTQAPTATATPSPAVTPSPTATSTPKSGVKTTSLAAAATGPSCSLVSASLVVDVGQYVTYLCDAQSHPIKVSGANITSGWEWSYNFETNIVPTTWLSGSADSSESTGNIETVYIYLRPTSAAPGGTGSVDLTIRKPNGNSLGTFQPSAIRTLTIANFALSCSPVSVTVSTNANGTSTCTLNGIGMASGVPVTVNGVSVVAPTGWTITRNPTSGSFTSGGSGFSFTLTLTPGCAAATSVPTPNVTINSVISATALGNSVTGPSTTITAIHTAASNVSASITSSSITWSRAYSFAPQSVSGSITIQVSASSGCAGWNVQLSASSFNYSGSFGGSAIPNGNAAVTTQAPSAASGSLTGVAAGPGGVLSSAQKVVSASASNGLGTYNQMLGIGVTIPGAARVGTYTSTITITAAAGP